MIRRSCSSTSWLCCVLLLCAAGCGGNPSAANIQLRKENQKLQNQLVDRDRQHQSDQLTIQTYEKNNGVLPRLTQDRLDQLVIANGLALGRLTGGHSPADGSFDGGISVYATPVDEAGDPIKVAGSFKVEAFDLNDPSHPLMGTWTFDWSQARKLYYAQLSLHTFILPCPWQAIPAHRQLTVHVTFTDELTGREFVAEKQVTVNPPSPSTSLPTAEP